MKRMQLLWIAFLLTGLLANAQSINSSTYKNAIGLRAGGTSGLTMKHFFGTNKSIEGILGIWRDGFNLTGLYEITAGTGIAGLNWYYGAGGHVGATSNRIYSRYDERYFYRYRDPGFALGVDGILGLEYKINPIPFAISFDLKPLVEVNDNGYGYWSLDPGLGIKFTF